MIEFRYIEDQDCDPPWWVCLQNKHHVGELFRRGGVWTSETKSAWLTAADHRAIADKLDELNGLSAKQNRVNPTPPPPRKVHDSLGLSLVVLLSLAALGVFILWRAL